MGARTKTILLIEDAKTQALLIKSILEKNHYIVNLISDGKKALKYIIANGNSIDMILLDYHLPSLNGLEILEKISAIRRYPVIFMTSDKTFEVAVRAMRAGALDFIPKEKNYINFLPDMVERVYHLYNSVQEGEKIEEQLREKEFLEQMINGIHDPFFVRDNKSRYVAVNNSLCALWGLRREEIIGKTPFELFNKKKAFQIIESDNQIRNTNSILEVGDTLLRNNQEVFLAVKMSAIRSPSGDDFVVGTMRDITYLKKTEETLIRKNRELKDKYSEIEKLNISLKKNENWLNSILSITPVGIAVLTDRVFQFANQRFFDITGYQKEELIGQDIKLIYQNKKEYEKFGKEIYPEVFESGNITLQTKWRRKNGNVLNILLYVTAMDKEDQAKGVTLAALDITERISMENELMESRKKYLDLYNNSPDMYISINPETLEILEFNNTFIQAIGYNRDKIIGSSIYEIIHPESYTDAKKMLTQYALNGYCRSHELLLRTRQRIQLIVNSKISSVKDNRGELLCFVLSWRDITEKKIVNKILHKREQEFKVLVENTPDIIARYNSKLKYIYVNPAIEKEIGIKPKDIIGRSNKEISFPVSTVNKMENAIKEVFSSGKEKDLEITFRVSEKKVKTLYSRIVPEYSEGGKADTVLSITRDISDYKRIQKELLNAKIKAEESDKLKSAFLANMSHEIRTPMNAIIGFSELLEAQYVTKEQRKQYISFIQSSSNNLLQLIDDIIDIAKIEAGELTIRRKECNLGLMMQDLSNLYKKILTASTRNKVQFLLNIPANVKKDIIITDPTRLKQVLSNLLTNAIKFTNEGYIELGYQYKGKEKVEFFVKDTGIGISKDYIDVIFDRFRQIDNTLSRRHGGTGLGLTISKNMVRLLGGDIKVSSKEGVGSNFLFTIPVGRGKAYKQKIIHPAFYIKDEFPNWEDKVILVAEDEDTNYAFIQEVLYRTNASVIRAKNGNEAIDLFIKNNIDLVLMDIKMPEKNGLIAAKEIRKKNNTIPIIAQTAYAMEEDRVKCIQAGCIDYITKPIKQSMLISVLRKYM